MTELRAPEAARLIPTELIIPESLVISSNLLVIMTFACLQLPHQRVATLTRCEQKQKKVDILKFL